jgi:hypothetical protein
VRGFVRSDEDNGKAGEVEVGVSGSLGVGFMVACKNGKWKVDGYRLVVASGRKVLVECQVNDLLFVVEQR